MNQKKRASGGCLCRSVRFEVKGEMRPVVACHCRQCQRWHGHYASYSAATRDDVVFSSDEGLTWFHSSESARRGFCAHCGTSLFWDRLAGDILSIAAGVLDQPSGLETVRHIFVKDKGDYYELDDGLPKLMAGQDDAWHGGGEEMPP
ncbi:MAG: GFA family protein [Pseudomonadota bacterium]